MFYKIENLTNNLQFIATRPQQATSLKEELNVKVHKFTQLSNEEKLEFLIKFAVTERHTSKGIVEHIDQAFIKSFIASTYDEKIDLIIKTIELNKTEAHNVVDTVNNALKVLELLAKSSEKTASSPSPLMIRIAVEIANDKTVNKHHNFDLYTVFKLFIDRKIQIANEKELKATGMNITEERLRLIMGAHQGYAIKLIFKSFYESDYTLKRLSVIYDMQLVSNDDISMFGVILTTDIDNYVFIHLTTAEYFVAMYLIKNIDHIDTSKHETVLKLNILMMVLFSGEYSVVKDFLNSYASGSLPATKPSFQAIHDQNLRFQNMSEEVTSHQLLNYLSYSDLNQFYMRKHKIELKEYLKHSFTLTSNDFDEFLKHYDEIKESMKGISNLLKTRNKGGKPFFHEVIETTQSSTFKGIIDKIPAEKIKLIFTQKGANMQSSLMLAAKLRPKHDLELFWNLLQNFSSADKENFLLQSDNQRKTALHASMGNKNPESFIFIKNVYSNFIKSYDIMVILTEIIEDSFVYNAIVYGSAETCTEVSEFLIELYEHQTEDLEHILDYKNHEGTNIFDDAELQTKYVEKIEIFKRLRDKIKSSHEEF